MRSRKLVLVAEALAEFGGAAGTARLLAVRVAVRWGGFDECIVGVRSYFRRRIRLRNMLRQPILLNGSLHLTSHPRIPRQMPIANKGRIAGGDGMYRSVSHEGNYKGLREAWLFRVRLIAQ